MKLYWLLVPAALGAGVGTGWMGPQPQAPPELNANTINVSYRPKVKPASNLKLAYLCPTDPTLGCRLILSWIQPANFNPATDTARTKWLQVVPTSSTLRDRAKMGTADTVVIARPTSGTKSGTVSLCYTRVGWNGQACNSPLSWSIELPVIPPDTATGLKLIGVIIKPDSAKIDFASKGIYFNTSGKMVDKAGNLLTFTCPAGGSKCPQQQFCGYGKMGDLTIAMLASTDTIAYCRGIFDKIPNHRSTYDPVMAVALPGEKIPTVGIHIDPDENGYLRATSVVFGDVRLAKTPGGDWIHPDLLPIAVTMK